MHRPPPATTAARTDPIAPATDDWPTTRRFSRRAGEAFRSADYAAAVELPAASRVGDAAIAIVMVIGSLLGAAVTVLWQVGGGS